MRDLYRLIYVSRCALPEDPTEFTAGIRNILSFSRKWNADTGTTGALMCSDHYFAQVLEGPAAAIKATFGHIACDPRNQGQKLLEFGPCGMREFSDWSMAFVEGDADSPLVIKRAMNEPATQNGRAILTMLKWLVSQPQAVF